MQEFLLTFYVVIIFVAAVEITFVNSQRPLLNNSIISINSNSGSGSGSSSISSSSSSSSNNTGGNGINSSSFYKNKYTSGNVLSSLSSPSSSSSSSLSSSRKVSITTTSSTTTTTSTTTKMPITLKSSFIQHYYPDEDFEDDVDDMKMHKIETTTVKAVIAKPPLTSSVRSSSTSSSSSSFSSLMPIGKEQRYNQQQQTSGRRRQQQQQQQKQQKQIKSISEFSTSLSSVPLQNLTGKQQSNKTDETIFLGSSSSPYNHRRYTSILKYLPRRPSLYSNDSAIINVDVVGGNDGGGVGVGSGGGSNIGVSGNGINDGSYNIISNLQGSAAAMISPTSQQFPRQQQQQPPPQQQQQQQFQSFRPSRGRKNSINDLRKMSLQKSAPWLPNVNNNDRQSDDPAHASDKETYEDPFQALKRKVKINSQFSMPYPSPLDTNQGSEIEEVLGVKCTFESDCAWSWEKNSTDGFHVVTGANLTESNMTGMMPGPPADSFNDANGHFIHVRLTPKTGQLILTSPSFSTTLENCKLEMFLHQSSMAHGFFRVVIEPSGSTESSWVPAEIAGNDLRRWDLFQFRIGRISKEFRILFEIVPNNLGGRQRGHVSIDNLRMRNCFPEGAKSETCRISQVKCKTNKLAVCIEIPRICDINVDCDESEDELLNCDKIPFGGRCDFENGWCGWHNSGKAILLWSHHSGPTPTEKTGPDLDHTYQHTNITGHYMFVNMNQHANDSEKKKLVGFASNAVMNSVIFNPPPSVHSNASSPYRNSCMVRFYVHQFGMNAGSINLSVVEMKGKENITTTLWWSSKNLGQDWIRAEIILPHITSKYFLQFEARMGMRIYSDVAVDDFSLSPECFGINIPAEHLQGYNYWDPRINIRKKPHKDFEKKGVLELTTCGARGIHGPTQAKCTEAYNNSDTLYNNVKVIERQPYKGMQLWKVPNEGYYTIIVKGAGGGLGSGGVGSSRGAMAIAILELHKHEEIYVLVGQSGEHACIKTIGYRDEGCDEDENSKMTLSNGFQSKTKLVKNIVIEDGAGGGGGASYVFLLNPANVAVPLIVAGGGGGLGIGRYLDNDFQHGQGYKPNRPEVSGQVHAEGGDMQKTAGPGGGWRAKADSALDPRLGAALLEGGRGGLPCYSPRGYHGQGGFGGGGGGCNTGGGGGGYAGGDTYINATNGEGGTSYIGVKRSIKELSVIYEGANSGTGSVIIIPAIEGCGCDYRCIALDEFRSLTQCICPDGWKLKKDNSTACEVISVEKIPLQYLIIFFAIITILLIAALTSLILILYNRYQRKKQAALRHKMLLEQDLQLSRLRNNADDSALTNFNPNYGCDGILNGNVDVKSLPQVARESLRLVKALGQGAFGEVYQGLYRHRDGDAVEMPVAVKTLPEMSTGQAEADFLMEAAIMAKFNHPNIVHLIGVCFDRHPRFIVLELLAGGDLKNFLREGRNKPERPSPLTMRDLVFCALDVAKGCRYMESKRFIHRDIAARNCLLSSKGPGRVVKIADFGMARDIYRSDYYRKGGKAMLPIKWMPPEAFLDGIFTSKTDVWSFGVLLWEVFSLGLMPYTGLPNRDVMQLVTGGGRLDAPAGCPPAIYRIMADCWNPSPEERPTFSNLLERLTTCTQDPEVMNAPLPSIFRPPSSERDQTIMRPPGNDDFCLQVPNSSDYLIPLPGPRSAAERLINEATGVTLSETVTTCSVPTVTSPSTPCRQNDDPGANPANGGDCWETSFIMPNSKSDQPLLSNSNSETMQNGINGGNNCGNVNGLIVNHHNNSLHHRPSQVTSNNDDNETKLISLDTPQPTPTTIKPPMSFAQLDGITLDPAALVTNKGQQQIPQNQAQKLSYANVQMINSTTAMNKLIPNDHMNKTNSTTNPVIISTIPTEKMNGNGGGGNNGSGGGGGENGNGSNGGGGGGNGGGGGSSSFDGSSSTISANSAPFTIQGYNERYSVNNKDNHSEISC